MPMPPLHHVSAYVNHGDLWRFARKLRSRAAWMIGDSLDDVDARIQYAGRMLLEGIADDLDRALGFDSVYAPDELVRGLPKEDL